MPYSKKGKTKGKSKGKPKGKPASKATYDYVAHSGYHGRSGSRRGSYSSPVAYSSAKARSSSVVSDGKYGLRNDGNTCFFNSMLQTTFHLPSFVKALEDSKDSVRARSVLAEYWKMLATVHGKDSSIGSTVSAYASSFFRYDSQVLSTADLRSKLSRCDTMFRDGCQHDSWMALSHLLTEIAADWALSNSPKKCPIGKSFIRMFGVLPPHTDPTHSEFAEAMMETLVTHKVIEAPLVPFYGVEQMTETCYECGEDSTSYLMNRCLEVDWKARDVKLQVLLADGGVFVNTKGEDYPAKDGPDVHFDASTTVGCFLKYVEGLPGHESDRFPPIVVLFDANLDVRSCCSADYLSDIDDDLFAVLSCNHVHVGEPAGKRRAVFSLVINKLGKPDVFVDITDFVSVSEQSLLHDKRGVRQLCADAVGLKRGSKLVPDIENDEEMLFYVLLGNFVMYNWNCEALLTDESLASAPIFCVLFHKSQIVEWNAPKLFLYEPVPIERYMEGISAETAAAGDKRLTLGSVIDYMLVSAGLPSAMLAKVRETASTLNKYCPVVFPEVQASASKDFEFMRKYEADRFASKVRRAVKSYQFGSLSPFVSVVDALPRSKKISIVDCIETKIRRIACGSLTSQCLNPKCELKRSDRLVSKIYAQRFCVWPEILLVHLNRNFEGSHASSKKDDRRVECPLEFDIADVTYKLRSASIHSGYTVRSGHYTAIVRNSTKDEWFNANDSSVYATTAPRSIDNAIYAVYEKLESKLDDDVDDEVDHSSKGVSTSVPSEDVKEADEVYAASGSATGAILTTMCSSTPPPAHDDVDVVMVPSKRLQFDIYSGSRDCYFLLPGEFSSSTTVEELRVAIREQLPELRASEDMFFHGKKLSNPRSHLHEYGIGSTGKIYHLMITLE